LDGTLAAGKDALIAADQLIDAAEVHMNRFYDKTEEGIEFLTDQTFDLTNKVKRRLGMKVRALLSLKP